MMKKRRERYTTFTFDLTKDLPPLESLDDLIEQADRIEVTEAVTTTIKGEPARESEKRATP